MRPESPSMTWYYLAGELSLLLMEIEAAAGSQWESREASRLRHRAETVELSAFSEVVEGALVLLHGMCDRSFYSGDAGLCVRQVELTERLEAFASAAGLR